jgi:homoserine O-acetyltransferase
MQELQNFFHRLWTIVAPQDARDIYYQLGAWADFNVGDTPGFNGDANAALGSIKARTLLIAIKEDLLVRREEMLFARDAINEAVYLEIASTSGHVAFPSDPKVVETMNLAVTRFFSSVK